MSCIDVDERWIYHKSGGARGLAGWGQNAWLRHGLLAFRPHWTLDFTRSDRSAYLSALSRSLRRNVSEISKEAAAKTDLYGLYQIFCR
jgi:hypothetical protein